MRCRKGILAIYILNCLMMNLLTRACSTSRPRTKNERKTRGSKVSDENAALKTAIIKLQDDLTRVSAELETVKQQKDVLESKYCQLSKDFETLNSDSNRRKITSSGVFNDLEAS